MSKSVHVTIANKVFDEIEYKRKKVNSNRSEFVEELIRVGLQNYVDPIM